MFLKTRKEIQEIKADAEYMISLFKPFNLVPAGPKDTRDICDTCLHLMDLLGGKQIYLFNDISSENRTEGSSQL